MTSPRSTKSAKTKKSITRDDIWHTLETKGKSKNPELAAKQAHLIKILKQQQGS